MTKMTSRLAGAALIALGLAATPALAFDTGGDDTSSGAAMTQAPAPVAKPKVLVPTLAQARADINGKNWSAAIDKLKLIVKASPNSADAFNLLGFSYRNAGQMQLAGAAYGRALKLDPKHTGALEYQGILFVKLGEMDKAKANLALLKTISGTGSEEYKDLAQAIG